MQDTNKTKAQLIGELNALRTQVEELERVQWQYEAVVNQYPGGMIAVFDDALTFSIAGGEGLRAVGMTPEDFEGKKLEEIFPPAIVQRDRPALEATLEGNPTSNEVKYAGEYWRIETQPIVDGDENVIGGLLITRNITDSRRADDLLQQVSLSVWERNVITGETFVSPQWAEKFGYTPESLEENPTAFDKHLHPDDQELFFEYIDNYSSDEIPAYLEVRLRTASGDYLWFHVVMVRAVYGPDKRIEIISGFLIDITRRKEVEASLLESETHLRAVQRLGNIGHFQFELPQGETIWSDETFRILGLDPGKDTESDIEIFIKNNVLPADQLALRDEIYHAVKKNESFQFKFRVVTPEKAVRYVQCAGEPVVDGRDFSLRIFGTIQDITAQHEAAAALERSESQFRSLAENSLDIIARFDTNLNYLYVNPAGEKVSGKSNEEMLGKPAGSFAIDSPAIHKWKAALGEGAARKVPKTIETEYEANHTVSHYSTSIVPEFNADGKLESILSVGRDITNIKQAEASLRRYKHAVESAKDLIAVIGRDGVYQFVNEAYLSYHAKDRGDVEHKHVSEVLPKELCERVEQKLMQCMESGEPLWYDHTWTYPSLGIRHIHVKYSPIVEDDVVVSVCAIIRDITDIKRAEEKVLLYKHAVEASADLFAVVDRDQNFLLVNNAYLANYGKERMELESEHLSVLLPEDLMERIQPLLARCFEGESVRFKDLQNFAGTGERYMNILYSPIRNPQGEVFAISVLLEDISDIREAELLLQQYRHAVESSDDLIMVIDSDFTYRMVNQKYLEFRGLSSDEVIGKTVQEALGDDVPNEEAQAMFAQALQGETVRFKKVQRAASGDKRVFSVQYSPFRNPEGEVTGVVVSMRDLYPARITLEQLASYEKAVESSADLVVVVDSEYTYQLVNEAYAKFHGVSQKDITGKATVADVLGDDIFESQLKANFDRCLQGEPLEYTLHLPDARVLHAKYAPIKKDDGSIESVVLTIRDVTELSEWQKRADLYKLALEASSDLIWVIDKNYTYRLVNATYLDYHQRNREDLEGASVVDVLGQERFEEFIKPHLDRALAGEVALFETNFTYPDRGKRWIVAQYSPLRGEDGEVTAVIGGLRDVTSLRSADEQLGYYKKAVESSSDQMAVFDADHRYVLVNGEYARYNGRPPEEILGKYAWEIIDEDYYTTVIKPRFEQCLQGEMVEFERAYEYESVGLRHIRVNYFPIREENDEISGVTVVIRDITELVRRDEKLGLYKQVVEASDDLIIAVDHDYHYLMMNQTYVAYHNLNREDLSQKTVREVVGEEYFDESVKDVYERCLAGELVRSEFDYDYPGKGLRTVHVHYSPLYAPDNETVQGAAVILRDVTDQRATERERLRSQEQYRVLVENSPDFVGRFDDQLRHLYVNPAQLKRWQKPADQIIGRRVEEMHMPAQVDDTWLKAARDVFRTGEPHTVEIALPGDAQKTYYLHAIIVPEISEEGKVKTIVSITRDITSLKQIQEAERQQRHLAEALVDIAGSISSSLELDDVLDRILDSLDRVVPHDASNVVLIDNDVTSRIVRSRGYEEKTGGLSPQGMQFDITATRQGKRIRSGLSAYLIQDTTQEPDWPIVDINKWIYSHISVPIIHDGKLIGMLNLASGTRNAFSPKHIDPLRAFAAQAAVALNNAHLHDQIQQHATELEERVRERTQRLSREIAERISAEQELRGAYEKLSQLQQVKDDFIANVSHELRTPITNLKLYHHLIARYPKRHNRYVVTLNRETSRLETIVEALLLLSEIDHSALPVSPDNPHLNKLVSSDARDRERIASARGISLEVSVNEDLDDVALRGEARLISRIFDIIMTNSLNYTPPGGTITVITQAEKRDGDSYAGFLVTNNGPVIPETEMKSLFERFFRGSAGQASNLPGTGLGLSIARELVDMQGGHIEVESTDEQTVFSVWFPVLE